MDESIATTSADFGRRDDTNRYGMDGEWMHWKTEWDDAGEVRLTSERCNRHADDLCAGRGSEHDTSHTECKREMSHRKPPPKRRSRCSTYGSTPSKEGPSRSVGPPLPWIPR